MSRVRSLSVLITLAVVACTEPNIPTEPSLSGVAMMSNLVDGTGAYLVRFRAKAVPADFSTRVEAMGGEVIFAHAGVGIGAVAGLTQANADALAGRSDISDVIPDSYSVLDSPTELSLESGATPSDVVQSSNNPATAAFFARQWNMRAISAPAAWAAGKLGKSTTRVGILDTGIGYNHVDLNGLVDLNASVSFLTADENQRVKDLFPGAHTIADLNFHGTHVAATVASNSLAAAGVTSKVKLVGIKVCKPGTTADRFSGTCPTGGTLGGILYAADIGLDVINLSLGGLHHPSDLRGGNGPSFNAIFNAVFDYAYRKGTTVVVAAGNNEVDLQHGVAKTDSTKHIAIYATYCDAPHVICVSATGPTLNGGVNGPFLNVDALAFYTNFGKNHITVAAPGGNAGIGPNGVVFTSVWAACSRFSIVFIPGSTDLRPCQTGNFIVSSVGTSMAAPHVTGLAALIAGEVGHNPDAIAARLINAADDLGPKGNDAGYGFGRINVARALGL